jgi:hypothetical protein
MQYHVHISSSIVLKKSGLLSARSLAHRGFADVPRASGVNLAHMSRKCYAQHSRHLARVCTHLPREERATRDVNYRPLCKLSPRNEIVDGLTTDLQVKKLFLDLTYIFHQRCRTATTELRGFNMTSHPVFTKVAFS